MFKERRYEIAIEYFTKAIYLNPKSKNAYINRGIAKALLEKYKDAINDFDLSLSIDLNCLQAYSNRALAKIYLNLNNDALSDLNRVIQMDPKNTIVYIHRGLTYIKLQQYEAAIKDYKYVLSHNHNYEEVYENIGLTYFKTGRLEDSIRYTDCALAINSKNANAYNNRGLANYHLGRYNYALSDFNNALLINSKNAETYIYQGNSYQKLGLLKKAIQSYCMAIPYSMGLLTSKQHYVSISELLKFREVNEKNLLCIQNCEVWFANPDIFTDKDDGKYLTQLFPESEEIKNIVSSIFVYSCFGIFLTEDNTFNGISNKKHNVMWADYGDGSKGICLHYQYIPEQATKADQFSFDKITYVESISANDNISLFDTIQHGFFIKQTGFNFENEARFITIADKNSCKGKVVSESDLGLTLVGVDFGTECSEVDIKKVLDAVNARVSLGVVEFYKLSRSSAGSFELNRTKIANA